MSRHVGARRRWACLAAILLLAVPAGTAFGAGEAAEAPAGEDLLPFLGGFLRETRIVYPLRIGAWEAIGEHLYDAAELGASVRYQMQDHDERWIDVFFYPAGAVPPARLQEAGLAVVGEVAEAAAQKGWTDIEAGPLRAFTMQLPGEAPLDARSADFRLVRQEPVHSAMVLAIHRMYYVKGRFTVAATAMERDATRRFLEGFMSELLAATYIGSTGGCGAAPPVEHLPAGLPPPAGAVMSVGEGDGDAWFVNGRVLARDPEAASTRALVAMATGLKVDYFRGCEGADPHNPDVPGGKRELRLEYRTPAGPRGPGGWRPAPPRSGIG